MNAPTGVLVGTGIGIALGAGLLFLTRRAYEPTKELAVGGVVRKNFPAWASGRSIEDCMAQEMKEAVLRGKDDMAVRDLAIKIIRSHKLDGRQYYEVASAIQFWVMTNVTYVPDIVGTEVFQEARVTIEKKAGDCDDQSILVCALLMSVGIPARIILMSQSANFNASTSKFTHVFGVAILGAKELKLETIIPNALPDYLHPCTALWRIEIRPGAVGRNIEINPEYSEALPVPGEGLAGLAYS